MEPEEDRGGSTNEPAGIAIAGIKKGNSNCSPFFILFFFSEKLLTSSKLTVVGLTTV